MSEAPADSSATPLSADRNLPAVQPPTFGFLIQLFVIPGLIVTVIVGVWMLFNWLAHMGSDPRKELETVRSRAQGSWHAAYNLAQQLQRDRQQNGPLTQDAAFNKELAQVLADSLRNDSPTDKSDLELRFYLCRTLGLFRTLDGVETLYQAAESQRADEEIPIQIAAIDALSQLALTAGEDKLVPAGAKFDRDRLRDLLIKVSRYEKEDLLDFRLRAAFHLGEFDEPAARDELTRLLEDSVSQVRYNAATSLAKQGANNSLPALLEMLTIEPADLVRKSPAAAQTNRSPEDEMRLAEQLRLVVIRNALDGLVALKIKNPDADLSAALPLVEKLTTADQIDLVAYARAVLDRLTGKQPLTKAVPIRPAG